MNFKPMLAENIDESEISDYIADDNWVMEQKFDGQRYLVVIKDAKVSILNRQGQPKVTNVSPAITNQFETFTDGGLWVFDGEFLDGQLQLFDLVRAGRNLKDLDPLSERRFVAEVLFNEVWVPDPAYVQLTYMARTADEKAKLIEVARADQCEGVMVKDLRSAYENRRSRRLLKMKFTHDVDAIVTEIGREGKDNAVLTLLDPENDRIVEIGTASTIGKKPTPQVGQVWRVKYLYFTDSDRKLYQPRLVEIRRDKDFSECLVDQLVTTSKHVIDKDRLLL